MERSDIDRTERDVPVGDRRGARSKLKLEKREEMEKN
jgi:hypothetical protein